MGNTTSGGNETPAVLRLQDLFENFAADGNAQRDRHVDGNGAAASIREWLVSIRFVMRALTNSDASSESADLNGASQFPELVLKLAKDLADGYHGVRVVVKSDFIRVYPDCENGFDITLMSDAGRCTVAMGPWYDEFYSWRRALEYLDLGLSGGLRVRVDNCRGKPVQWAVERRLSADTWVEEGVVGMLRLRKPSAITSVYLINSLLRTE